MAGPEEVDDMAITGKVPDDLMKNQIQIQSLEAAFQRLTLDENEQPLNSDLEGVRSEKVGVVDAEHVLHKGFPSLGGSRLNKTLEQENARLKGEKRVLENDQVHGWGIDSKIGYCAQGVRSEKVGVVDAEYYVLHKGIPSLGGSRLNKTLEQENAKDERDGDAWDDGDWGALPTPEIIEDPSPMVHLLCCDFHYHQQRGLESALRRVSVYMSDVPFLSLHVDSEQFSMLLFQYIAAITPAIIGIAVFSIVAWVLFSISSFIAALL